MPLKEYFERESIEILHMHIEEYILALPIFFPLGGRSHGAIPYPRSIELYTAAREGHIGEKAVLNLIVKRNIAVKGAGG